MSAASSTPTRPRPSPWIVPLLIVVLAAAAGYAIGARRAHTIGAEDDWSASLVPSVIAVWLVVRGSAPRGRLLLVPVVALGLWATRVLGFLHPPSSDDSIVVLGPTWDVSEALSPLRIGLVAVALIWALWRTRRPSLALAAGSSVVVTFGLLLAAHAFVRNGDVIGGTVVLAAAAGAAWLDRAALLAHRRLAIALLVATVMVNAAL